MSFNIKKKLADGSIVQSKVALLRPLQKEYLHDNVFTAIDNALKNNDNRIITIPAHTGSGKTFTILSALIPSYIARYSARTIIFAASDVGCVDSPSDKFTKDYNGKLIKDVNGEILQIKVYSKDELKDELSTDEDNGLISAYPVVSVAFISMQMLYKFITDPVYKTKFGIDLIIIDEIHHGNGTPSANTMRLDQGRYNSLYHPAWLTALRELLDNTDPDKTLPRIIGSSGTLTNSQREGNAEGHQVFNMIPELPKKANNVTFTKGFNIGEGLNAFDRSKREVEQLITEIRTLVSSITSDTWDKAAQIEVTPQMPAFIFKYARNNAINGVTMQGTIGIFKKWLNSIGADYARSTCDSKEYGEYILGSPKHHYISYTRSADIIQQANSVSNATRPLVISLMESGNMGWDIPRIVAVVNLSKPSAKDVTNMQEQLCARSNRLLFNSSHDAMRNLIANLDVDLDQKKLLAKYVCKMSTSYIFYVNSDLMANAYCRFAKNTYSEKEGLELYMKAIDEVHDKKVIVFPNGKLFTRNKTSYSANLVNQVYKLSYCQACAKANLVDSVTGKTWCEVNTRKSREFEREESFTDEEWMLEWIHALDLDHLLDGRNVYDETNLQTRCPNTHKAKTWGDKDYLNRYTSDGTVYKVTQNTNTY